MTKPLEQGDTLGDFEIVSVAGVGGMGVVYKAKQKSLDRDVALKVIREEIASETEFRERFMREARLAASVDHPNVVTVYDVGEEDDRLYLVMQWIDGSDVKEQLQDSGRFPPKRAVAIGSQIAGALDALHSVSGLIHRDVKPANVLLRTVGGEEHAYLTDFGIAKPPEALEHLTKTGSTVGTTGYLSPEQIQGGEAGPRSDLYALGCLVYEMLTGKPPFEGENELAVRWAHANDPRPLVSEAVPALGQRYDEFFAYALAVDPAERFGNGREFAEALTGAMTSESTTGATAVISQPRTETKIGPPTPLPPGRRPQTPPPGYQPAYGYATPPPQPRERSGNPLALILLAIVAVAGIAVGALAAAGVFSNDSSTNASTQVSHHPAQGKGTKRSHQQVVHVPSNAESCGDSLWVNSVTTCPFAENTRSAYAEDNGAKEISSYSPVTGETYAMKCEGAGTVVCRGGSNAAVWFTSAQATGQNTSEAAPEPEAQTSSEPVDEGLQSCDQNISANSATSCPFAENVFVAYWEEYEEFGEQYETYLAAFSEATGETIGMECLLEAETVDCYGGEGAFVTFPMWAVRVYGTGGE
ncbi:MAG: serine/threonine-protein kinase [Solirubrobacterales bacterium]